MNRAEARETRKILLKQLPRDRYGAHLNNLGTGEYEVHLVDTEGNVDIFNDIVQAYLFLDDYLTLKKEGPHGRYAS